ncbi:hypothetical protein QJQ45_004853 [Haematococcus lacustris]|nr:hypothetical protein QJQ45_004853 [Haematococcus lacustris]
MNPICTSILPPHLPPLLLLRSDVKPDPGLQSGALAAKDLVVAVVAMLDKHLPASEVPMLAEAYMRMEEWFSSPHGAAQLEALRKAYAATLLKCAGMSSTMIALTLWKSIQRLLEQTPAQTPSFDADQNQDMAAVEPLCGAEAPPSPALQKAPGGLGSHHRHPLTCTCLHADSEKETTALFLAAGGQCPMDHDVAGTSSAPGPAAAPGSLVAAAFVAKAGLGVDPLPHVQEWGTCRVGARCFEVVQKPIVKQLGLKKSEPGSRVPILVALVMEQTGQPHASGAVQDLGILNLPCLAKQARGPKHSLGTGARPGEQHGARPGSAARSTAGRSWARGRGRGRGPGVPAVARAGNAGRGRGRRRGRGRGPERGRETRPVAVPGRARSAAMGVAGRNGARRGGARGGAGAERGGAGLSACLGAVARGAGAGARGGGGRSASLRTGAWPRQNARPEPAARRGRNGARAGRGASLGEGRGRGPGARAGVRGPSLGAAGGAAGGAAATAAGGEADPAGRGKAVRAGAQAWAQAGEARRGAAGRGRGRGLGRGRGRGRGKGQRRGRGSGRGRDGFIGAVKGGARRSGAGYGASLGAGRGAGRGVGRGRGPRTRPGTRPGARPGARPGPAARSATRPAAGRGRAGLRGRAGTVARPGEQKGARPGPAARSTSGRGGAAKARAGARAGAQAWARGRGRGRGPRAPAGVAGRAC